MTNSSMKNTKLRFFSHYSNKSKVQYYIHYICSKLVRHKLCHFLGITHIVVVEKYVNLQDGQLCKRGHVSSVVKFIQSQSGMRQMAFPSNTRWNFTIVSSMTQVSELNSFLDPKKKHLYESNLKGNWDLLVIGHCTRIWTS